MKRKLLYLMTIIVALLATCIAFVSCSDNATSKSYKYHKDNIKTLSSVVDSSMAESMLSALETSCAIGTNTKLVAEDMREINDNCYELYAGLMVRFYVQDGQLLLYTFETNYNDDSKILLYNSSEPDKKKVLTETERKSLVYTQRRAVVHSTLAITPREGALLHNALGSTKIDLTFKNKSSSSIVYLHINTTPCISGVEYSYNGKGYVLNEDLPVGGSMTRSLTTTGWKNYDSYKITKATIMFADGSTIGFDSFDCQFLDGNGDSPDTILRDSQITYHLYDDKPYPKRNDAEHDNDRKGKQHAVNCRTELGQLNVLVRNFQGFFFHEQAANSDKCDGNAKRRQHRPHKFARGNGKLRV